MNRIGLIQTFVLFHHNTYRSHIGYLITYSIHVLCIIYILCLFIYTIQYFRCANTDLGDVVSELLSALLNRLTELEQHEEKLRACQSNINEVSDITTP